MRIKAWILSLLWRHSKYVQYLICSNLDMAGYAWAEKLCDKRVDTYVSELREKAKLSDLYFFTVRFNSHCDDEVSPGLMRLKIPGVYVIMLPEFALEWSDDALRGVIAHELAHLHLGHEITFEKPSLEEYIEKESFTDMKAAEWVGHSEMIATLESMIEQLHRFPEEERDLAETILDIRIKILEIARVVKNVKDRPTS